MAAHGGYRARVTLRTGRRPAGSRQTTVVYWMTRAPPPAAREAEPDWPELRGADRRRRQAPDSRPRPPGTGWRMPDLAGAGSGPIGTEAAEWPPADVVSMVRNCSGERPRCVNRGSYLRLPCASAVQGGVSGRSC